MADVSEREESKLFAPLDATVSLRTCQRGQASSGQDWRGAGIVGRWLGTSSLVRAVDAWKLIAILGRWPAARVVRSSPAFAMTIESGGLDSFRLFTGRALSLREQKFALEQARFDRAGPAKSPQEVC